jgi:hypothetical protein
LPRKWSKQGYPDAIKIRLVQDNLNTHNASAFYEHLPADEAFALAQRFEFDYTPRSASWFNMIECEFSALSRGCLHQRIPTIEQLRTSVRTLLNERSAKKIKIHWQFSIQAARTKRNTLYERVQKANAKFAPPHPAPERTDQADGGETVSLESSVGAQGTRRHAALLQKLSCPFGTPPRMKMGRTEVLPTPIFRAVPEDLIYGLPTVCQSMPGCQPRDHATWRLYHMVY